MNKVFLMGRLTKDPEIKSVGDTTVTTFTIAVSRDFKAKNQPDTDFFNCKAWGAKGEFVAKWFTKGKMILVEGSIEIRPFEDSEGKKRFSTEIRVDQPRFCGDKGGDSASASNDYTKNAGKPQNVEANDFEEIDEDDDELPF